MISLNDICTVHELRAPERPVRRCEVVDGHIIAVDGFRVPTSRAGWALLRSAVREDELNGYLPEGTLASLPVEVSA